MTQNYDNIETQSETPVGYQVVIANIVWNKTPIRPYRSKYEAKRELPDQMTFDVPEARLAAFRKSRSNFDDEMETYIYNALTNKFGHEVQHCQIYLPLDK